jgi:hypothetical protein
MFLLVSGASGAGKSTARRLVADKLEPVVECLELHDVVPIPRVPTLAWRQRATWEHGTGYTTQAPGRCTYSIRHASRPARWRPSFSLGAVVRWPGKLPQ